jgi:hypothetical protein
MPTTPSQLVFTEEVDASTIGDQVPNPPVGSLTLFSNSDGIWYSRNNSGVVTPLSGVQSVINSDGTIVITGTATAVIVSRAAITGDVSVPAASDTATLATVNSNVGTWGTATSVSTLTVNAKGLVTAASNTAISASGIGAVTTVQNTDGTITVTGSAPTYTVSRAAITGDVSVPAGSDTATLATVNSSPGTFGSASQVAQFTVNGKGLVTSASNVTISIPFTDVTGQATLAQLPTMTADTVLGNGTASSATPTDLPMTGTGSANVVMSKNAQIYPREIDGVAYVDTANNQGWSGSDAGAWINSAYAYLQTTYSGLGGVIQLGAGTFTVVTPILLNSIASGAFTGFSILLRGTVDGNAGTILNYTGTTANSVALSIAGGSGNNGGVKLENFQLMCASATTTLTGIQIGCTATQNSPGPATNCTPSIHNVAISVSGSVAGSVDFANGITWANSGGSYGAHFFNCHVQNCTTGYQPVGENNVIIGGLIGSCTTAISIPSSVVGGSELTLFGVAFDANTAATGCGITLNLSAGRVTSFGCRYENPPSGTESDGYVNIQNGVFNSFGDKYQSDSTAAGTHAGFVAASGGTCVLNAPWISLASATPTFTQIFNPTSPADFQLNGLTIATGSAAPGNIVPTTQPGYLKRIVSTVAVGTTQTIVLSLPLPLNTVAVGETFDLEMYGTQSALSSGVTVQVHIGTGGTTADTVLTTVVAGVAASGGLVSRAKVIVRTISATGTVMGECVAIGSTTVVSTTTATQTFNSTVTEFLTLSATVGTGTFTVQVATIQPLEPTSH